ncbi:MAG: (d)CMP kinase [Planctomycetota bacterium]
MATENFIITIDGPAGSGKTTVARKVAERLRFRFLDTGAMYRVATLAALEAGLGLDPPREAKILAVLESAGLNLDSAGVVMLSGRDVSVAIRSEEVTRWVSAVAALRPVREFMVRRQKEFGLKAEPGLVAEGRDMGTVVFPGAAHRFYLDASVEVRAGRRLLETCGGPPTSRHGAAMKAMAEEILARDEKDSARAEAPLRVGDGVQVIDTSDLSVEQVVERVLRSVRAPA